MPTFLFKGIEKLGGIPRHSRVRVEALPKRHSVFSGTVTNSVALELDPGKYAFKIGNFKTKGATVTYAGTFLWGVTEEEYNKLKDLKPKTMKISNTSEGVRYLCQYTGCDGEFTSRTGAVLHESEHMGQTLIEFNDENFTNPIFETAQDLRAKKLAAKTGERVVTKLALMEEQKMIQEQLDKMAKTEQSNKAMKASRAAEREATVK